MKRALGKLLVSPMGLGCMGMSEFYGKTDEAESIKTIHFALDHGITLFDTADIYGFGDNERLLAKALSGRRQQAVIASKCGIVRDPSDPVKRGVNGSPEYIKQCVEASLRRLAVDEIDLFYLHRIDRNVPIEDSVGALSEMVAAGKIRAIGLSEASATTIRRANAVHAISAVQSEYSMVSRDVENNDVLKVCAELGIGFVAYSPLCRALLSDQPMSERIIGDDFRQFLPRFNSENIDANQRAIFDIQQFAKDKGLTVAQLSLAWLLAQGENIVPIPGTKRSHYLNENIAAMDIAFSSSELAELNGLLHGIELVGARYPDEIIEFHNLEG